MAFLSEFKVYMRDINRRRHSRFAQKERARTFCTFLEDKYFLYTPVRYKIYTAEVFWRFIILKNFNFNYNFTHQIYAKLLHFIQLSLALR